MGFAMSGSLIHEFMPKYRMRQIDRVRVKAPPEEAWHVMRALDLQAGVISRALFALRELPHRMLRGARDRPAPATHATGIESFTGPGKGFQILAEQPGREIVIGSAGKFWKPDIEWAPITPVTFLAFDHPGNGKLVWNLRVDPDLQGGSWLTWELRVTTTDEETWRFFRRYWFVIGKFSHWLRRSALKRFRRRLGGSPSEESLKLAADELVPRPRYQKTMATTIEAPPAEVWPWLVQMGCRRGAWYCLTILTIRENEALVLGTRSLLNGPRQAASAFDDTWAFVLEPIGGQATRLITRVRADYPPEWRMYIMGAWLASAHRVMEWVQLRNLKQRIEGFKATRTS